MKPLVHRRALSYLFAFTMAVSCCFAGNNPTVASGSNAVRPAIINDNLCIAPIAADTRYMENAAQLASDARRYPPRTDSDVVALADVTVERMLPNALTSVHVQQIFYIANEHGVREYSTRTIQYYKDSQQLEIVHARVFKRDGRTIDGSDDGEKSVADNNASMYYDTVSRTVRFPSLQRGDVVELEYRLLPNAQVNPFGSYFGSLIAFQSSQPQRLHRYVLIAPSSRRLNIVQQRMPSAYVSTANSETTYRWEMRNIAPLPSEPRGPSLTEVAPYVDISTFANWNDLGRWYAAFIASQFSLSPELRENLARITAGLTTDLEKIHAIHEFVLRSTRYKAMEYGVFRYKPYPVADVFERHFGDCKDKASLMIALMRAVGIDADLALVRTTKLGDVSEKATSISIFDHAVAYIPKYDLWLDGTAQYAGFHELPLEDQGAMALTVDLDGEARMRRIPVTSPMDNYTHRVVRAQVEPNGKIVFTGLAYTRGEDAPGLRREYEVADKQVDTLRANLAQVYPTVQVDAVHVDGANSLDHDIIVNFRGSLNTFAGHKSLPLNPSWLPHKYVTSLAPLASRTQELQLPAPWTTVEELHFTIPEGATLHHVPANWTDDTPFGTASVKYEWEGRELVVTTSVQFRKLRIEPKEYAAFRAYCQDVESAFHQEIRVSLSGLTLISSAETSAK